MPPKALAAINASAQKLPPTASSSPALHISDDPVLHDEDCELKSFTDALRNHSITQLNRNRETRLSSAALRRHQLKMSLKKGAGPPPALSAGAAVATTYTANVIVEIQNSIENG